MSSLRSADAFERLIDSLLDAAHPRNPWRDASTYEPDFALLERLLSIPVRQGAGQQTGRLARATDAWTAQELRCAGFGEHEVWPRRAQRGVRPLARAGAAPIARQGGSPALRRAVRGWSQAKLLGQYYAKQVDVVIADWDRGAELIVSTKSMLSSYWNNLRNRFEEFVGDAKNLRGRYPLASIGILFVARSTIFEETGAFQFVTDMLTRLRHPELFDTAGLVVAGWDDTEFGSWQTDVDPGDEAQVGAHGEASAAVSVRLDEVPAELHPATFCRELIEAVLRRTPVTLHVRCRERKSGKPLPVPEETQGSDEDASGPDQLTIW
jgi:hypothetical protein